MCPSQVLLPVGKMERKGEVLLATRSSGIKLWPTHPHQLANPPHAPHHISQFTLPPADGSFGATELADPRSRRRQRREPPPPDPYSQTPPGFGVGPHSCSIITPPQAITLSRPKSHHLAIPASCRRQPQPLPSSRKSSSPHCLLITSSGQGKRKPHDYNRSCQLYRLVWCAKCPFNPSASTMSVGVGL